MFSDSFVPPPQDPPRVSLTSWVLDDPLCQSPPKTWKEKEEIVRLSTLSTQSGGSVIRSSTGSGFRASISSGRLTRTSTTSAIGFGFGNRGAALARGRETETANDLQEHLARGRSTVRSSTSVERRSAPRRSSSCTNFGALYAASGAAAGGTTSIAGTTTSGFEPRPSDASIISINEETPDDVGTIPDGGGEQHQRRSFGSFLRGRITTNSNSGCSSALSLVEEGRSSTSRTTSKTSGSGSAAGARAPCSLWERASSKKAKIVTDSDYRSGSIKQPLLRNVKINRGNNFFNVPIDDEHAAAKRASSTKPPLLASSRFNGTFQDNGRGSSSSSRRYFQQQLQSAEEEVLDRPRRTKGSREAGTSTSTFLTPSIFSAIAQRASSVLFGPSCTRGYRSHSSVTAVYSLEEDEEDDECGFSQKSSKASTAISMEEREEGPSTTTSVAVKKHVGEQEGRRSRTTMSDVQSSFSNTSPRAGEHHVDLVCAILSPDPRDRVSDSDEGGSPLLGDGLGGRETVNLDMELGSGCAAAAIDGLEGPADSDSGSHPLGCMDPPDR